MALLEPSVYEFWRDTKKDSVWAVEVRGGEVLTCSGPLSIGEAVIGGDLLDMLDYSTAKAAWLQKHRDRFRTWEPCEAVIWPT